MNKPEDFPLYQVNDSTGELTLFVRCKLCNEAVWDRSKDGPVKHDALIIAGATHLTIRHADGWMFRPTFKGFGNLPKDVSTPKT